MTLGQRSGGLKQIAGAPKGRDVLVRSGGIEFIGKMKVCSALDDLGQAHRGWGIAAAFRAYNAVYDSHTNAREVTQLHAFEDVFAGGMLCLVHEDEVRAHPFFDKAGIKVALSGGVAIAEAEGDFSGDIAECAEHGDHAQDAEWLDAGASGAVCSEDDLIEFAQFSCGIHGENGGAFIAVVDDFEGGLAAFAQADDLVVGQGGVSSVDVTDDVCAGFHHHVCINEAGTRDGGATGVDCALDAVFARP